MWKISKALTVATHLFFVVSAADCKGCQDGEQDETSLLQVMSSITRADNMKFDKVHAKVMTWLSEHREDPQVAHLLAIPIGDGPPLIEQMTDLARRMPDQAPDAEEDEPLESIEKLVEIDPHSKASGKAEKDEPLDSTDELVDFDSYSKANQIDMEGGEEDVWAAALTGGSEMLGKFANGDFETAVHWKDVAGVALSAFSEYNPYVKFFCGFIKSLIGDAPTDTEEKLIKKILKKVDPKISKETGRVLALKIGAIAEEIQIMPKMLNQTSKDATKKSQAQNLSPNDRKVINIGYLLMVQHDLSTKMPVVFSGDCLKAEPWTAGIITGTLVRDLKDNISPAKVIEEARVKMCRSETIEKPYWHIYPWQKEEKWQIGKSGYAANPDWAGKKRMAVKFDEKTKKYTDWKSADCKQVSSKSITTSDGMARNIYFYRAQRDLSKVCKFPKADRFERFEKICLNDRDAWNAFCLCESAEKYSYPIVNALNNTAKDCKKWQTGDGSYQRLMLGWSFGNLHIHVMLELIRENPAYKDILMPVVAERAYQYSALLAMHHWQWLDWRTQQVKTKDGDKYAVKKTEDICSEQHIQNCLIEYLNAIRKESIKTWANYTAEMYKMYEDAYALLPEKEQKKLVDSLSFA